MEPDLPRRLLVVGDVNLDLGFEMALFPREGDDVAAGGLQWSPGGAGLNATLALTRIGAATTLLARVGRDPGADLALRPLRGAGVDLRAIQVDTSVATGLCGVLISPGGQRTFVSFRGANAHCDPEVVGPDLLDDCAMLYICGHALLEGAQRQAALRAIGLAGERGIPVALDLCLPTISAAAQLIFDLLPHIWLLTMNEAELFALLPGMTIQQSLAQLLRSGVEHLAVKRGAQGCSVATQGARFDALPPAVAVVDTNGCGDAFTAGYAWALLRGADLPAAATLANLMGALTATRLGAASAVPTRSEIAHRLDYRLHHLIAPA